MTAFIPTIKQCQERLIKRGYPVGPDGADGKGGKNTQDAIIKFQTENHIDPVTGQFDEETVKQLFTTPKVPISQILSWVPVLINLSQGKLSMNKDQFINLVQTVVNIGAGVAVSAGILDANTWVAVGAAVVAIATYVYTHFWNKTT